MQQNSRLHLILAFAAVYVIWGSTYLGIKLALDSFPPFLLAGLRFIIAGSLLFVIAYRLNPVPLTWRHWRSTAIIGGLLFLVANAGVVWAEQYLDSGLTALIVTSVPFWMVVLDWVRPAGQRPTWPVVSGLVVGFLGIILLVGPDQILTGGEHLKLLPVGVLLLGSFSWALGSIYTRHAELPSSPALSTAMEMLCGGILLMIASLITGDLGRFAVADLTTDAVVAFAYLIAVGSLVGFSAYVYLLNHTTAARAATYAYVNPLVALILGWIFADEKITGRTLVATTIIIGSVVMITTFRQRTPPKATSIIARPEPRSLDASLLRTELPQVLSASGD